MVEIRLDRLRASASNGGPCLGLDATINNVVGAGSRFQFFGAVNDLQSLLKSQLLGTCGFLPRLELGVGGSRTKQWFTRQSWLTVDNLRQECFWTRAQVRIGMEERGLLQAEVGKEKGTVTVAGTDLAATRADLVHMEGSDR